jgi:hypothetical protein
MRFPATAAQGIKCLAFCDHLFTRKARKSQAPQHFSMRSSPCASADDNVGAIANAGDRNSGGQPGWIRTPARPLQRLIGDRGLRGCPRPSRPAKWGVREGPPRFLRLQRHRFQSRLACCRGSREEAFSYPQLCWLGVARQLYCPLASSGLPSDFLSVNLYGRFAFRPARISPCVRHSRFTRLVVKCCLDQSATFRRIAVPDCKLGLPFASLSPDTD